MGSRPTTTERVEEERACRSEHWERLTGPMLLAQDSVTLDPNDAERVIALGAELAARDDIVRVRVETGFDCCEEENRIHWDRVEAVGRLLIRGGLPWTQIDPPTIPWGRSCEAACGAEPPEEAARRRFVRIAAVICDR